MPGKRNHLPILIGERATPKFGPPKQTSPYNQGFRVAVSPDAIGLLGESDEATSYAIFEVLDGLGCRWYLPGEMGEVIPRRSTLSLRVADMSSVPANFSREIWYADDAFKRRNRLGGFTLQAGHALEVHNGVNYGYLTRKQLEENPDWNALMDGKRSINGRFCWGSTEVSTAVADSIIARLDKKYAPSISIAPDDGEFLRVRIMQSARRR